MTRHYLTIAIVLCSWWSTSVVAQGPARQPSIGRVMRAASAAYDAGAVDAEAMADRARRAGWVPKLTMGVRRGQRLDLSASQSDSSDRLSQSTDDDLSLYATLTFELDRVVFRREELGIRRQARVRAEARREHLALVVGLYHERRALLVKTRGEGVSREEKVRIEELAALLDVFTNGAFKAMMVGVK